jgi:hypothetical protein
VYAIPSLAGPGSGIASVLLKPTSPHHPAKSATVKSNASANSISMFTHIISPNAFSRLIGPRIGDFRFDISERRAGDRRRMNENCVYIRSSRRYIPFIGVSPVAISCPCQSFK